MKKIISILLIVVVAIALIGGSVLADGSTLGADGFQPPVINTIPDGTIVDSNGNTIELGFDQWGYNYQGRVYSGYYENYSRPDVPVTESDTYLLMKWNDAWLSNVDRDLDGELDRHYDCDTYIGSGAWLTNEMHGVYEDGTRWTYFCKIIAVPADAYSDEGIWYASDDTKIGPVIWGSFAITMETSNDPEYYDEAGLQYSSPYGIGLGQTTNY